MTTFLNVLLDILLGGSIIAFIVALVDMVIHEEHRSERVYQSIALTAGAIAALGAQASGIGFATYTINSLSGAHPSGAAFKAISVIIPGGLAAGFGWYFVRVMRKSTAKGMRFMAFLGMLTAVAFAEIFAQATRVKGVELGVAAIPNASFVVGLIISVLVFAPEPGEVKTGGGSRLGDVLRAVRGRAPRKVQGLMPVPDATQKRPTAPVNPWAED